ncbi:RNA polymerase sigma factor [Sporosarcina sp. NPDC096371]|uniref:RNA polymerase sigma factor n=1 Tax=Sporosarcina sp. NPDC096371 TaxID=3364530 RepID=UPI0037FF10F7
MGTQPSNEEITQLSNEIVYKLCAMGANPQDARDIVQESLYRGFLNIDAIPAHAFRAWLYKVAINQYYDLCRKRTRHPTIELDDDHLIDKNDVENAVIEQETKAEYDRALQKLNAVEQQLVKMKYEEGYSYKEMSGLLDIKENTIKTYLYRARKKLITIFRREMK